MSESFSQPAIILTVLIIVALFLAICIMFLLRKYICRPMRLSKLHPQTSPTRDVRNFGVWYQWIRPVLLDHTKNISWTPIRKIPKPAVIQPNVHLDFIIPPTVGKTSSVSSRCASADDCYLCTKTTGKISNMSELLGTSFDPKMYRKKSSIPGITDVGKLALGIQYDPESQFLNLAILRAAYLKPHGLKETADVFVRICLTDNRYENVVEYRMTQVCRATRNPVFEESFAFPVPREAIDYKVLTLSVCDYDRYSRPVVMGSVTLPLAHRDQLVEEDENTDEIWFDLIQQASQQQGELMVSLCHLPDRKILRLTVMRAKCLKLGTLGPMKGGSCVYAKATMLHEERVISTKRTKSKDILNPSFNEVMDFRYAGSDRLENTSIVLTLCVRGHAGVKHLVGKTTLGPEAYATGAGLSQWSDMMSSPRSQVAQWLPLR